VPDGAMDKKIKLLALVNAAFVVLYLLWNWAEYSILSPLNHVSVKAHFPLYIQFSGSPNGNAIVSFFDFNFGFMILLLATVVNLFVVLRLKTQER
jgi:hypothetical protein